MSKIDWRKIWKWEYTDKNKAIMQKKIVDGEFDYYITKSKHAVERIVEELIVNEIPFKVQSMGAGFRKIVAVECICPECKGKGVAKKKKGA